MSLPKTTFFSLIGCILVSKGISTSSPYLLKYGITQAEGESSGEKKKTLPILLLLGGYYLSRFGTTYLNELRNTLVAKASISPTKEYTLGLLPTDPFSIRERVPSVPIFIKTLERKKKAYKSLFTIKYTHIIPTGIELGLAGLLVSQQLGLLFSGTLCATVGVYIARSIQITNGRVEERKRLNDAENKWCHSTSEYITDLSTSITSFTEKDKREVDTRVTNVLLEEKKLTDSLLDLNTQQQLILGTGGIVMSYLWYIQPDLGISDFVMMNLLIQQLFQPLNQVGMIYREWKQSVGDLGPLTLPPRSLDNRF